MSGAEPRSPRPRERQEGIMWLSGFVSLVGAWIAVSGGLGLFGTTTDAEFWSAVVVGLSIFLVSGYNFYRIYNDYPSSLGAMAMVLLLGLWMVVVSFLVSAGDATLWNFVVSGVVVALGGAYNTYETHRRRVPAPQET